MRESVCISGVGIVSPLGTSKEEYWSSLAQGIHGFSSNTELLAPLNQSIIIGSCNTFDPSQYISSGTIRRTDRYIHLALAAASEAIRDSSIKESIQNNKRAGVIIGTGLGGLSFHEEGIARALQKGLKSIHPLSVPKVSPGSVNAHIAMEHSIIGQNLAISTACSSGMNAIGEAYRKVKDGYLDYVICGGVEAPLTPFTTTAYKQMHVLDNRSDISVVSQPFDQNRIGFILSEGTAMFTIEKVSTALQRGASIYGVITGYESNCGAHNIAMPKADSSDIIDLMNDILDSTNCNPSDIDMISTHGTGTQQNDEIEAQGIEKVFSDIIDTVPLTAVKSLLGHSLGAAGALQIAASLMTLHNGSLPVISNLHNPIRPWNFIRKKTIDNSINRILHNCFGFGSNNAAILLERYSDE